MRKIHLGGMARPSNRPHESVGELTLYPGYNGKNSRTFLFFSMDVSRPSPLSPSLGRRACVWVLHTTIARHRWAAAGCRHSTRIRKIRKDCKMRCVGVQNIQCSPDIFILLGGVSLETPRMERIALKCSTKKACCAKMGGYEQNLHEPRKPLDPWGRTTHVPKRKNGGPRADNYLRDWTGVLHSPQHDQHICRHSSISPLLSA